MSVDLTGNDIFTDPVVTMGDGDPVAMAEGALLRQGFQALVDRDHYLKARIEEILSNGAGRIRKFTLPAAIKGLASPVDGDCVLLTISGQVPRLFFFRSGAYLPAGDVSGLAYDSTAAVGYWATELTYLFDSSGKLNPAILPVANQLLARWLSPGSSTLGKTGSGLSTWADVGIESAEFSAVTSDFFEVHGHLSLTSGAGAQIAIRLALANVTDSTEAAINGSTMALALGAGGATVVPLNGLVTAAATKTYKVKVQWAAGNSDAFDINTRQLITLHYRP